MPNDDRVIARAGDQWDTERAWKAVLKLAEAHQTFLALRQNMVDQQTFESAATGLLRLGNSMELEAVCRGRLLGDVDVCSSQPETELLQSCEISADSEGAIMTKEESQLLDVLEEQESTNADFKLLIERRAGAWEIELWSANVKGDGGRGVGTSFDEAWNDITPSRA